MTAHKWKTTEDAVLRKHYRNDGPAYCARVLGLGIRQVYDRAQALKLKTARPRGRPFESVDSRRGVGVRFRAAKA